MANWLKIICAGTKVEWLSKYLWTFMKKMCNICLCQPWWSELDLNWTGIPTSFFFLFFLSPPFHFSTFQLLWMAFNTSLQPQRHLLEQRNSSEWIRTSILNILPACVLLSPSPLLLPPSPPSPPILLFFSFCPTLCSVCVGVEPLYRDGVLGRASKAFITAFAVLCYTGKHRATHAWPLTSLWSSAIHEKRGLWPTNLFLI